MKTVERTFLAGLRRRVRRFHRSEDGIMAPQILFFFLMMILVGGVAVDVMRFETKRVAVQQTLDRATLAAASLEQSLNPVAVVNDYFAKAGLGSELDSVTVTNGTNYKIVQAKATATSGNYFMSMMDVPFLEGQNRSQAEQRINDIEIIMVLDVSGSMAGAKLSNLKTAAKKFIDDVMTNDVLGRISIGIVPYNAQVTLGGTLRSKFNATHQHGVPNADCLELTSDTFAALPLSRVDPFPMMAVADTQSGTSTSAGSFGTGTYIAPTNTSNATPVNSSANRWCNPSTAIDVTLPSKNRTALKAAVDELVASGNTSIVLGMRFGTALLDPSARPIYNELIASGHMTGSMAGRPYDHANNDAMKVVILMTDGQHVAHNRIKDPYKTGLSPIYRGSDGNYSFYYDRAATTNDYWVPHGNNGAGAGSGHWQSTPHSAGVQQTWPQVWASLRMSYVAFQFYGRGIGNITGNTSTARSNAYNAAVNAMIGQWKSVADMDMLLSQNCTAAKDQGVLVYGIAFEAPAAGQAAINDCASSPKSTYFHIANGSEIGTAFDMIALHLSQLRLTQ